MNRSTTGEKKNPLDEALTTAESKLNELIILQSTLKERLSVISSSGPVSDKQEADGYEAKSPITNRIRNLANNIDSVKDHLTEIINSLDI